MPIWIVKNKDKWHKQLTLNVTYGSAKLTEGEHTKGSNKDNIIVSNTLETDTVELLSRYKNFLRRKRKDE